MQKYSIIFTCAIENAFFYAKSLKQVIFLRKVDCFGFFGVN